MDNNFYLIQVILIAYQYLCQTTLAIKPIYMYIYKMHVSKASFTLTQLSIQHLFLENSSKAVNSPIVLLLLWITTRQLSWKKKNSTNFKFEKSHDFPWSNSMSIYPVFITTGKHCEEFVAFIYTQANTFSVLSRLCRKLFEYTRTFWLPLSHNLTTFLKYWRFSKTNASKARDLLWPIPSPTKFFLLKRRWSHGTYYMKFVYYKMIHIKKSSLKVICLTFSDNVTFCNTKHWTF